MAGGGAGGFSRSGPGAPGGFSGPGASGGFGGPGSSGGFGAPGSSGGFGGSGATDGTGVISAFEARKWKDDVQFAFNPNKQVELLREWLGFRQIDLSGAEMIISSTMQSNQCEITRLLAQQCTDDRAKIKAQFRTHMQMDNWTAVFAR